MIFGVLNLSFWGYLIATLVLTQITIASVTIYLHRCQSHRALTLHPVASHFFRFWLWLTTGMITAQFVAIHRKHHASTDVEGDPHSPVVFGIKKVLWQGMELYSESAKDEKMIERYSHGTPKDWIEGHLYSAHSAKGRVLMLAINLLLFGLPGISIWAVQMMWIPFWAAGVVNGLGHFWGYRNHETPDAARNLIPFAFWIGGEELHNNHHTFASSAKFSLKWWEFDLGWMYILMLSFLGLAKVKKLPPKLSYEKNKLHIDLDTVKALVTNRFQLMSQYYKKVVQPMLQEVKLNQVENENDKRLIHHAGSLLRRQSDLLCPKANSRLQALLQRYEQLRLVYNFRQSLQNIWLKSAKSQQELIESLQLWCQQAEESGLERLGQFSLQLKSIVLH